MCLSRSVINNLIIYTLVYFKKCIQYVHSNRNRPTSLNINTNYSIHW